MSRCSLHQAVISLMVTSVEFAQIVSCRLLVDDEVTELHHMAALVVGAIVARPQLHELVLLL